MTENSHVHPAHSKDFSLATEFENHYRESYKVIDQGITLVTEGKNDQANTVLQHGLSLIDKALTFRVESFESSPEQIQVYLEMQNKMRITRKEVLLHFSDSQLLPNASHSSFHLDDAPPSYTDYLISIQSDCQSKPVEYPSLDPEKLKLQAMEMPPLASPLVTPVLSPQAGERIFHLENGVQIFFIYANGRVTSPSYPSFLSIFTFQDPICCNEQAGQPGARGFLQVGEWSYPLVVAQSPVLHSFYGAYMFPDATNPEPGTSVGILIPDTVSKDDFETFEQILSQMTSYQDQVVPQHVDAEEEKTKVAQSSAQRISQGAEAVSKGVIWGSEQLSHFITYGSEKIKGSLTPEAHQKVDPKWQKTAEVARNVSGKAVQVSGFVLSQVGKATLALGKKVAPSLHKQGSKALTKLTGQTERDTESQVGSVLEVASGAVVGASTIYMSLEQAASILATSLSDNTVKVVTHKYGPEYGSLTGNTLHAVGQTAMVGHNLSSLGVKGIAKRTAKDTGKALLTNYSDKKLIGEGEVEIMDGVEEAKEATEHNRKCIRASKMCN